MTFNLLINLSSWLRILLLCGLVWMVPGVRAQDFATQVILSSAEEASLRAQLSQAQPPGLVGKAVDQWFERQDEVAFRLGDPKEREKVLRAWNAASPGLNTQWVLGSFLMEMSSNTAEGFRLLEDLLRTPLNANQSVRLRSRIAFGYIEEHQLKKAQVLLDEALAVVQRDLARLRTGVPGYWAVRAEMEFYRAQARFLMRQGRFDAALDAAQLASKKGFDLRQLESFADPRQVQFGRSAHAYAATEVAVTLISAGRLYAAEDALREAYAIFKAYQFTDDKMVGFYRFVSDLYFSQGRYSDALKQARSVQDIQKRTGLSDSTVQSVWSRLRVHRNLTALKRWDDVRQEFESMDQAVATNDRAKPVARMVELRGHMLLNTGRPAEATALFQGSLKWASDQFGPDHYFTSYTRGLFAMALAQQDTRRQEALPEFERAIRGMTAPDSLSNQFEETPFRLGVKRSIFQTYLRMLSDMQAQRPEAAAQAFALSGHLMNSSVQQAISEAAARSAIKQPGLGEIARLDQDAKSELLTLYSYITAQSGESQTERTNPEVVRAMRDRVKELETLRRDYKSRIQREFPEYFQLLQPRVPSPGEVARLLRPGEVFVSIVPTEQETYAFAIGRDGRVRFHRSAIKQSEIDRLVKTIRTTLDVADLGARAPSFRFAESHQLYQQLLAPLEESLAGQEHLIVATTGSLGQLPFAVLVRQPWTGTQDAQAPWLVKDLAISHITSPSAWMALKRLGQTPAGRTPLMAWGDPAYAVAKAPSPSSQKVRSVVSTRAMRSTDLDKPLIDQVRYAELPPLPETRDEVLALAKVLQANVQSDVLLGAQATRESVLLASENNSLRDRQVIVFATHGLLPGDLPRLEQPALAMAGVASGAGSPLLTLEDVMGLRLNADWVVLSACNTAGADGKVEEALSGLARGFFYAGSRSLLVTHWSVESESAMQLTTKTFDAYHRQSQLGRAQALRQAMLAVMKMPSYAHPTFWGPYALVGEGGR